MTPSTPTDADARGTNAISAVTGSAVTGRPTPGVVARFDFAQGLGEVTDLDGTTYPFHCTAITDGTRDIADGTGVIFTLGLGHLGRVEAATVYPVGRREAG